MDKKAKEDFIISIVESIKTDLLKESARYPDEWDGVELRWRIRDMFSSVVWGGEINDKRGKRYKDYDNTVIVEGFK